MTKLRTLWKHIRDFFVRKADVVDADAGAMARRLKSKSSAPALKDE